MRYIAVLVFILLGLTTSIQAEDKINEYMNDIYFANGINVTRPEANRQLKYLIRKQVKKNIFNGNSAKMNQTVDFKLAYNNTLGIYFDMLEAYQQKKAEHGTFWWVMGTFFEVYGKLAKIGIKKITNKVLEDMIKEQLKNSANQFVVDPVLDNAGLKNLVALIKDLRSNVNPKNVWATINDSISALEEYDETKQYNSYMQSINLKHRAIVIAHGQGNLFTNVVYDKIPDETSTTPWMRKHFYMVGVASPAGKWQGLDNQNDRDRFRVVTFDNDPITQILDIVGTPIKNPKRYIIWDGEYKGQRTCPCLDGYYDDGTVPETCGPLWYPADVLLNEFHTFEYYINTNISNKKIFEFIKSSLVLSSQDTGGGTDNGNGGDTNTGGGNSGSFDYKTQCSNIDFPDPIPDELENSINEAISKVSGAIDTETLCQTINGLVQAYNLANGGGVPSF